MKPLAALLTLAFLAVVWTFARREPEIVATLYAEPDDGVQPPDPRTVGLAFPKHDPAVIHVEGSWSLGCRGCEARERMVRIFEEAERRRWD